VPGAAPGPPVDHRRTTIAKRKKRRPAGPPPAKSPKLERAVSGAGGRAKPQRGAARKPTGPPVEPSFKGIVVRAAIIAGVYYMFLVFLLRTEPGVAILVALLGFLLMLPIGWYIDRRRYRTQLRRWNAAHGGGG